MQQHSFTQQKCTVAMEERTIQVLRERKLSNPVRWEQSQLIYKSSRPRTGDCFPTSRTRFMSLMDQRSVTSSELLTSSLFMVSKRGSSTCGRDWDTHGKHSPQSVLQLTVTGCASGFRTIPNKIRPLMMCQRTHCSQKWLKHTHLIMEVQWKKGPECTFEGKCFTLLSWLFWSICLWIALFKTMLIKVLVETLYFLKNAKVKSCIHLKLLRK